MSRHSLTTCLLIAALGIGFVPAVMAWTPYGYGPYGPGYQAEYPGSAAPEAPTGTAAYQPDPTVPAYPAGGYSPQSPYPYGTEEPRAPYLDAPPDTAPPIPPYPGYGPGFDPYRPYPGFGQRGFGRPAGFRISRATSEDAYSLTIDLNGIAPDEIQVRTQDRWILISRERTEQQIQKDSFDDGRGYMRSFSYSSGTSSQRLSVPRDGDLSAMSREDGENSIQIRIPRIGR